MGCDVHTIAMRVRWKQRGAIKSLIRLIFLVIVAKIENGI